MFISSLWFRQKSAKAAKPMLIAVGFAQRRYPLPYIRLKEKQLVSKILSVTFQHAIDA
jgi:hypothetical protein